MKFSQWLAEVAPGAGMTANVDAKVTLNGNTLILSTQKGTVELQILPNQAMQVYQKIGIPNSGMQPGIMQLPH